MNTNYKNTVGLISALLGVHDKPATFWRTLINSKLDEIARKTGGVSATLSDGEGGEITLASGIATFPRTLLRIEAVYWDSAPLGETTYATLNATGSSWLTDSASSPDEYIWMGGKKMRIYPIADSSGLLEVIVRQTFGHFEEDDDTSNPLQYMPEGFDLLPVYGVVGMWPAETESQQATKAEYEGRFAAGLADLAATVSLTTARPLKGG